MENNQKNELKIQALREALRERVSAITDEYENKIADLRIELTEVSLALQEAQARLAEGEQVDPIPEEKD
jgi:hypothetical protein